MKTTPVFLGLLGLLLACSPSTTDFVDHNQNGEMDLFEDMSKPLDERVADIISRLTLEQKLSLVTGTGMMGFSPEAPPQRVPGAAGQSYGIPELGIPSIVLADGPAGVRILPQREGDEATYFCTAFPIETVLASTWDVELVESVGQAMGTEALEYGVDVFLAPALNLHRNPLTGRNFEYYSEDPLLSGTMAGVSARGVQSKGVATSLKHYVANNQETNRFFVNAKIDERTLRELYLRGFEVALGISNSRTIMSSYNQLNGMPTSQNRELQTDVLRGEWGFEGLVMTDWFSGTSAIEQMQAGNDLLMPGTPEQREKLLAAVEEGTLSESVLDENLTNILKVTLETPVAKGYAYSNQPDLKAHAQVARDAAAQGIILLKNEAEALPLASGQTVAAFGNTSYRFISGGTGSGDVNSAYTVSLVDGLTGAGYTLSEGAQQAYEVYLTDLEANTPPKEQWWMPDVLPVEMKPDAALVNAEAQAADVAMVTLGRTSGEFADREVEGDFNLTNEEKELVAQVSKAFRAQGKAVVVVLNIGNVIETASWEQYADALVLAWQGGQEAGNAVADVLSGKVNPSGRLATTFPVRYEDHLSAQNFPGIELSPDMVYGPGGIPMGKPSEVTHQEGIWVGYRYFNSFGVPVAYPFGYGLSYSEFSYDELTATVSADGLAVEVKVTNIGNTAGKTVVQAYLQAPGESMAKPSAELKAFAKTEALEPGASAVVTLHIDPKGMASYDAGQHAWVIEPGTYQIHVGHNSRELTNSATVNWADATLVEQCKGLVLPSEPIELIEPGQ
ncbi:MAG TPA: glycosyl hydrolase [Cytophagales bacterium]|nr:glycosyl hydrolase [Cytophagales bacterium]